MVEQDAEAYAGFYVCAADLECHEAAIGGDDGVGGFEVFVVIEVGEADEVFAGAVEAQFVDVDLPGAVLAA
jgi:hypothetical protein